MFKTLATALSVVIGLTSVAYAEADIERDIVYCKRYAAAVSGNKKDYGADHVVTGVDILSSVLNGRDPSYRVRSELRRMQREDRVNDRRIERAFERCMKERVG